MATDRGEYRSTHIVVVDGPDFQALSPPAKLTWWTLRMTCGPLGIAVQPGLVAGLVERTGHSTAEVTAALAELEARGWIERERNVVWIIRALEFEPQLDVKDSKHRLSVRRRVAALPNLSIVKRFRVRYAPWFADEVEGLPSPSEGAPKPPGSTKQMQIQKHESKQEPEQKPPAAGGLTYAQRCTIAANKGLRANPAIRESFNELITSAQTAPAEWEAAGIPVGLAERVIGERARAYRPTARNRQPGSLRYFDQAVREEAERAGERTAAAAKRDNPFPMAEDPAA